jgi:hypothetical protein
LKVVSKSYSSIVCFAQTAMVWGQPSVKPLALLPVPMNSLDRSLTILRRTRKPCLNRLIAKYLCKVLYILLHLIVQIHIRNLRLRMHIIANERGSTQPQRSIYLEEVGVKVYRNDHRCPESSQVLLVPATIQ